MEILKTFLIGLVILLAVAACIGFYVGVCILLVHFTISTLITLGIVLIYALGMMARNL